MHVVRCPCCLCGNRCPLEIISSVGLHDLLLLLTIPPIARTTRPLGTTISPASGLLELPDGDADLRHGQLDLILDGHFEHHVIHDEMQLAPPEETPSDAVVNLLLASAVRLVAHCVHGSPAHPQMCDHDHHLVGIHDGFPREGAPLGHLESIVSHDNPRLNRNRYTFISTMISMLKQ